MARAAANPLRWNGTLPPQMDGADDEEVQIIKPSSNASWSAQVALLETATSMSLGNTLEDLSESVMGALGGLSHTIQNGITRQIG